MGVGCVGWWMVWLLGGCGWGGVWMFLCGGGGVWWWVFGLGEFVCVCVCVCVCVRETLCVFRETVCVCEVGGAITPRDASPATFSSFLMAHLFLHSCQLGLLLLLQDQLLFSVRVRVGLE